MYTLTCDKLIVIPIAFNVFYNNAIERKKKIIYSSEYTISEEFLGRIISFINLHDNVVAIDMEGATYSLKIFTYFQQIDKPIVFFNVDNISLRKRMKEDLNVSEWNDDETYCILNGQADPWLRQYNSLLSTTCKKEYQRIIHKIADDNPGNIIFLESADLYSNVYVDIKKLFLYPEEYYFILFGMAKKISTDFGEFDALISSSKNGAILANLLGSIMNKKVIHIMGIGPQYSLRMRSLNHEIKQKRSYLYVFDFICTGMEMKLLATLVNCNSAYLIGGIGIAQYKKSHNPKDVLFRKMKSLITISETDIKYKVAGTEEDLNILLNNL